MPDLEGVVIVMNGDILATLSYNALVKFHEREAALTIAMQRERVNRDLGVIESNDGLVTGSREKPTLEYDVSLGVYACDERALRHLSSGPCLPRARAAPGRRRRAGRRVSGRRHRLAGHRHPRRARARCAGIRARAGQFRTLTSSRGP